jgi:hypothetical protein
MRYLHLNSNLANIQKDGIFTVYLHVISTLKWLALPVESSVYFTVFRVPQVNEPSSNEVPLSCNPGKWHNVFLLFKLSLNEYVIPLALPLDIFPLFSPVDPFIEIVPYHLPFFLSALILKFPGVIITPFCPVAQL